MKTSVCIYSGRIPTFNEKHDELVPCNHLAVMYTVLSVPLPDFMALSQNVSCEKGFPDLRVSLRTSWIPLRSFLPQRHLVLTCIGDGPLMHVASLNVGNNPSIKVSGC